MGEHDVDADTLCQTGTGDVAFDGGAAKWGFGRINDTSAVEPLVKALNNKGSGICEWAALSLWEIADDQAMKAMSDYTEGQDLVSIANHYSSLMHKTDPRTVILLIASLRERGFEGMAADFKNSHNSPLSQAAYDWAFKHGYVFWQYQCIDTSLLRDVQYQEE